MSDFEITKPYSLDVDTKAIKSSISETYDSSSQVANRDGNLIERTEFIIDTILNTLPVRVEQSDAHTVSEGTYAYFSVQLFDVDGDPYLSTAIDISSATLTLEKSTLGGAFSSVGITQPTLSKGLGHIDTSILFKADEWEVDDLYRLSLSGVTVTNGVAHTLQHLVWNNLVSAVNDIDAEVDTILDIVTFPSVDNVGDTKIGEVIGTKGDTVDGTSIVSRIKQAIAQLVLVLADTLTIKTETDKIPATITKIDSIKSKTDNLPSNPASQTNVDLIKTETDKIPATITKIDGEVIKTSAIKAKTDNLPANPASQTNIDLIKAKTDNLPSDPADQSLIDAKLGLTNDTATHQTLLGYQNSLYQHVHQSAKVYPTLADGIVVTGGTTAWTLGNFIEIIPANAIATMFDIHYINFETASATDFYEFVLYKGTVGNEIEIGRVRTSRESATSGIPNVPIQIPAQMANTRISAKVASKTGGNDTVTISVYYHIYS